MARFVRFALRDLGIAAITAAAWGIDRQARTGKYGQAAKTVIGVSTGLLTALVGFGAHEWGHLAGALASGGVVDEPTSMTSPFLFFFDVGRSPRPAFLAMSYGGYIGTVVAAAAIATFVPRRALSGRVALAATAVGLVATFALEMPTTIRVARGGPLPRGGVYAGDPDRAVG